MASLAARRRWLAAAAAWDIPDGPLTAVATWLLDAPAEQVLADVSDAAVGPDGELYLISDRTAMLGLSGEVREAWRRESQPGALEEPLRLYVSESLRSIDLANSA